MPPKRCTSRRRPSAIASAILEKAMGDTLFSRAHRTVEVTPTGRRLAIATGRAFGELMRATTPLAGSEANRRLRLSISSTFVTAWLIPRIAGFMASHPEIELSIENSNRLLDLENEPFDAGIAPATATGRPGSRSISWTCT
jgi:LysR family glycine cleavage system transcriptional activator